MTHGRASLLIALNIACCFAVDQAAAQDYPRRPVRIVLPFPAGGTVDALARVVGNKLEKQLNQPFIIESRPGAGGTIGADVVAKSVPDGYTILHNTVGLAIAPAIFKSLPFDTLNDFAPITQLVATTLVLVASSQLPAKSIEELIALAKSKPGSLNYGSTGIGNPLSLTMEMFKTATATQILAVPYRGDALMMTALLTGEVHLAVVSLAIAKPLIEDGKIRGIAVTGSKRSPFMPDLPTIGETVPGFEVTSWQAFFAPAKTPRTIVELLQRETAKALNAPDVLERLRGWSNEPVASRPEEFERFFRTEVEKYALLVKDANIPRQ